MKKIVLIIMTVCLVAACTGKTPSAHIVTTQEELPFPIGNKIDNPSFTGEVFIQQMITYDSVMHFPHSNHLTFAPGAHSSWHRHGGMIVLVTGGVGLYQEEGKQAQVLRQGDVLQIPAGARHWHGATKDNWFSQIVIYDSSWRPEAMTDEDNTLSDEYYDGLTTEEYTHQAAIDSLMFPVDDRIMTFPTFNGPIRMANTVGDENVAGGPALHYVVFEPGVINAWHTHAGGQVIIATDGIGYHQIEGQPVEVLHPGDVAICPPGVRHWHGAAPHSRFAHLAANTNPDKPGVEWFEMLSKEEYDALPK